jgi:hypothetical protein
MRRTHAPTPTQPTPVHALPPRAASRPPPESRRRRSTGLVGEVDVLSSEVDLPEGPRAIADVWLVGLPAEAPPPVAPPKKKGWFLKLVES